jgi:hypothetical protein
MKKIHSVHKTSKNAAKQEEHNIKDSRCTGISVSHCEMNNLQNVQCT